MDDFNAELHRVRMEAHALAYAARGWPVFPVWWPAAPAVCACSDGPRCVSCAKHPLIKGGHTAATTDDRQIRAWWKKYPLANIGIATGQPSGFSVLDVDERHDGGASFQRLLRAKGRPGPTLVSLTGGGGRHILWRWRTDHRCQQAVYPGIDVRATGGYILAPPSMHGTGLRYEWHPKGHPRRVQVADAPPWADSILRGAANGTKPRVGPGVPQGPFAEGCRNQSLFRHACRWQRQALSDDAITDKVHKLNCSACQPPLDDREVDTIIRSALRYPKGAR